MRYLRLYAYFLRFSFSRAMEFRFDFFFRIVMDVAWYAMHLIFFQVVFLHTPLFGGWTPEQMQLFLAALFLSDALNMTIFANNMWWLPFFINRGDLDYYLVRPVSSLFFLSLRDFAANSFVNLVMTLVFLVYSLATYPGELPASRVALYLAGIGLGVLLHYILEMLFLIPVFWMHQGRGLKDLSYSLQKFSQSPDAIYRGWVRRILVSILPFGVMVSFPTRALFQDQVTGVVLHMLAVTLGLGLCMRWAWGRGLRSYSSASS